MHLLTYRNKYIETNKYIDIHDSTYLSPVSLAITNLRQGVRQPTAHPVQLTYLELQQRLVHHLFVHIYMLYMLYMLYMYLYI